MNFYRSCIDRVHLCVIPNLFRFLSFGSATMAHDPLPWVAATIRLLSKRFDSLDLDRLPQQLCLDELIANSVHPFPERPPGVFSEALCMSDEKTVAEPATSRHNYVTFIHAPDGKDIEDDVTPPDNLQCSNFFVQSIDNNKLDVAGNDAMKFLHISEDCTF